MEKKEKKMAKSLVPRLLAAHQAPDAPPVTWVRLYLGPVPDLSMPTPSQFCFLFCFSLFIFYFFYVYFLFLYFLAFIILFSYLFKVITKRN
jgi:hypothetical protein